MPQLSFPLADMPVMRTREKIVTVVFFWSAACLILGFVIR